MRRFSGEFVNEENVNRENSAGGLVEEVILGLETHLDQPHSFIQNRPKIDSTIHYKGLKNKHSINK